MSLLDSIKLVQFALMFSGICHKVVWHVKWKEGVVVSVEHKVKI